MAKQESKINIEDVNIKAVIAFALLIHQNSVAIVKKFSL